MKILYIEDDSDHIKAARTSIAKDFPDDTLDVATSYIGAVAVLESKGPFDLIICDFHFSGKKDNGQENRFGSGGIDFLQYLIEHNIKTPFMFYSAHPGFEIMKALKKKGIDNIPLHTKAAPFSGLDLTAKVFGNAIQFAKEKFFPKEPDNAGSVVESEKLEK